MKEVLKIAVHGGKKYALGILICSFISSFFTIYLTKYISFVIDGVIMQTSSLPQYIVNSFYNDSMQSKLLVMAVYMLFFTVIISVTNYAKSMFNTGFRLTLNKNLKIKLLEHTTYLEYGNYTHYGKSQILQRVSGDSNNFIDFVTNKYNLVVDSVFILMFSMYEILNINIIVSISIAIIIVAIATMSVIYFKLTEKLVHTNIDLHEDLISRTMNAVYNPKMIKIFNREKKEIEDFSKVSDEYKKNDTKLIDYLIFHELVASAMRKIKDPAIFLICGILIINRKMNIGALVVLLTYSNNLLNYIMQLVYAVEGINDFLVPARRINNFLKMNEEMNDEKEYEISNVDLSFYNVTVKINGVEIFRNVSFDIKRGQAVYLVGDNGSGKSTLVKVLLGFVPYEGTILLGGVDIKKLNLKTLRKYVGVVFQEPFIFSDTVKNNIDIFGKSEIEDVENVAKICEIHEEIVHFPNGYSEILGENGVNLSGGQKQRINIARTLLQNKEIMIFDDVLSKVDNETKEKIMENLKKYNNDLITIYITQDLVNIPEDGRVFFLNNRRMIIGEQKKLISENENYSKLINICNDMI